MSTHAGYRLTTSAGDTQDFKRYEDALREAGKLLDLGASWIRIEVR